MCLQPQKLWLNMSSATSHISGPMTSHDLTQKTPRLQTLPLPTASGQGHPGISVLGKLDKGHQGWRWLTNSNDCNDDCRNIGKGLLILDQNRKIIRSPRYSYGTSNRATETEQPGNRSRATEQPSNRATEQPTEQPNIRPSNRKQPTEQPKASSRATESKQPSNRKQTTEQPSNRAIRSCKKSSEKGSKQPGSNQQPASNQATRKQPTEQPSGNQDATKNQPRGNQAVCEAYHFLDAVGAYIATLTACYQCHWTMTKLSWKFVSPWCAAGNLRGPACDHTIAYAAPCPHAGRDVVEVVQGEQECKTCMGSGVGPNLLESLCSRIVRTVYHVCSSQCKTEQDELHRSHDLAHVSAQS